MRHLLAIITIVSTLPILGCGASTSSQTINGMEWDNDVLTVSSKRVSREKRENCDFIETIEADETCGQYYETPKNGTERALAYNPNNASMSAQDALTQPPTGDTKHYFANGDYVSFWSQKAGGERVATLHASTGTRELFEGVPKEARVMVGSTKASAAVFKDGGVHWWLFDSTTGEVSGPNVWAWTEAMGEPPSQVAVSPDGTLVSTDGVLRRIETSEVVHRAESRGFTWVNDTMVVYSNDGDTKRAKDCAKRTGPCDWTISLFDTTDGQLTELVPSSRASTPYLKLQTGTVAMIQVGNQHLVFQPVGGNNVWVLGNNYYANRDELLYIDGSHPVLVDFETLKEIEYTFTALLPLGTKSEHIYVATAEEVHSDYDYENVPHIVRIAKIRKDGLLVSKTLIEDKSGPWILTGKPKPKPTVEEMFRGPRKLRKVESP